MKCEEIAYRKCQAKVGDYDIEMDTKGNSCLKIIDCPSFGGSFLNRIAIEKKYAKAVLLEALAIVEELE